MASGEVLQEVQILQLCNGKANYIMIYKNDRFTIYWDSGLKSVIFLSKPNRSSNTEFKTVTNSDEFNMGLQYIVSLHPN